VTLHVQYSIVVIQALNMGMYKSQHGPAQLKPASTE